MADIFANGRVVDLIIGFMVIEALGLLAYRAVFRAGPSSIDIVILLAPGLALLLALRGALIGEHWMAIALCLLASLAAHLLDLWRRFPQTVRPSAGDQNVPVAASAATTTKRQEETFRHSG